MAPETTRERLLGAAEAAFAEQGFARASLRGITRQARANLAAVHYHFGSKEALFEAVVERRIGPINRERLARLDALEAAAPRGRVALEELVRAFVEPACTLVDGAGQGALFLRLTGRMFTEPGGHWQGVRALMEPVRDRYLAAFSASLPAAQPAEVFWRMHFMFGAMCHVLAAGPMLTFVSEGLCDGEDLDQAVERLVPFLTAGLHAATPAVTPARRRPG